MISSSAPSPSRSFPVSTDAFSGLDRLLQKTSENSNLPALGSAVSRVVRMASSDGEAVSDLAYFVLADVGLTQKILRIANTALYHSSSGGPVTTITKAIFLLGFDMVKTSALAMLLVDGMAGDHGLSVRTELAHALTASVIGREMARRSHFTDTEEAAIAALFKNMGRLLIASHYHRSYSEIGALIEGGSHTPTQASIQVLGCSFDFLAQAVLHDWGIPEAIIKALNPLPQGVIRPARTRQEWMQQVAGFSTAAATLIPLMNEKGGDAASKALLARFGNALNLDEDRLIQLLAKVMQETRALTDEAKLTFPAPVSNGNELPPATAHGQGRDSLRDESVRPDAIADLPRALLLIINDDANASRVNTHHPSGKPVNARERLMTGIQDISEMLASGRCKVNDLIMLALETLYHSMGFRFATICLKETKIDQFRARVALGERNAARQAGFMFSSSWSRDLFHLAMENGSDLIVSDASDARIRDLIPAWHRALLPDARSFIVLPLMVQKKPFGFFYGDRIHPAPEGVPSDEAALIRTLKGQVLAALNSRQT